MLGLNLVRKMPPKMTVWLLYRALPLVLAMRFFIGSLLGSLVLSSLLYLVMWIIGDPKPFTLSQLVLWIDGLPTDAKTAIVTSMLTVLGFLIAFHTATVNWKAQAMAHLKATIAGEIELFFNEAMRLSTEANIYIRLLMEATNFVQSHGVTADAKFKIQCVVDRTPAFLLTRDRLSGMSIEVHRIAGRHFSVLSTIWGATKTLEECATHFGEIAQKMWIQVPILHPNQPDSIAQFISQVNVTECVEFTECFDRNHDFISGATGGLRGVLLAPLVGFNLASVMSLSDRRSDLVEALSKIRVSKPE